MNRAGQTRGAPVTCGRAGMDGAHRRTLERALKVLQTKERLAVALEIPLESLEAYMSGEKPLPDRAFITAIDIVAHGKHTP